VTNDFLKIILTIVVLIAVVGAVLWFISDKYPMYAAKKEVQTALKDIANAYRRYGTSADETVTMELLLNRNWVTLEKETKQHWTFELVGDPPHTAFAMSTSAMPAGRDRVVKIDFSTNELSGWGIEGSEELKLEVDASRKQLITK